MSFLVQITFSLLDQKYLKTEIVPEHESSLQVINAEKTSYAEAVKPVLHEPLDEI